MLRRRTIRRASALAAVVMVSVLAGQQSVQAAESEPAPPVGSLGYVGCDPAGQIRNLGAPLGQVDFQAGAKCTHRGLDVKITSRLYRGSTFLGTLNKRCNRSGFSGTWCMTDHRRFTNPAGLQWYTLKVTTSTVIDPGSTPIPDYAEFSVQY